MFKTYIMHYPKLKERKNFILSQLDIAGIKDYEFIEDLNKEDLDGSMLKKYDTSEESQKIKAKISMRGDGDLEYFVLKPESISLALKHLKAFELFVNSEYEYALFLEDDCQFFSDFPIGEIIKKCENNWDVIVIGGAFDHNIIKPLNFFDGYILADHPATNTTSSIIYKRETAEKILSTMDRFSLPIDWELNHIFYTNTFNVYHTYPYLCKQVSNILFRSTVN